MSHHEEHDVITVTEFFEEYWPLMFFGTLFLMTVFLPLLAMDNRNWLYWGITITFGIASALLLISGLMGKRSNQPHS